MLDVKELTKSFGTRRVLENISFHAAPGAALALLGPSGIGKTTLLRIIAGLETCDAGEVWIDGACATSPTAVMPPERRGLGMVFQDLALWPHMRAWRHLEFVLRGRGIARAERQSRAHALLTEFGLAGRAQAYPAAMSGGEQQRLALARALITDLPLLLLDEPLANLDVELRAQVMEELRRRMAAGTAIVLATHDPSEASQLSAATIELGAR